jgi:pumilio RNA-binding family
MAATMMMGLPALALQSRLEQMDSEPPSWAAYLPPAMLAHIREVQTAGSCAGLPCWTKCRGRIWEMSQDPVGCREIQRAFESASTETEREALAAELQGHVCEAMRCPHANYVLQKCVSVMRPASLQFIIDELTLKSPGMVTFAARHKYGCRIIQRLLEHCLPAQVQNLADRLLDDAVATSLHPYGNYVMQHLVEHGTSEQRRFLSRLLQEHADVVGSDAHAGAVVGKAMTFGSRADQADLARALTRPPGLLPCMARNRHGYSAARATLRVLEGADYVEACRQILAEEPSLRSSRYGQLVLSCLKQENQRRAVQRPMAAAAMGGA